VLKVFAPDGRVVWSAPDPAGDQAISAQAAFQVTDILEGNTDPAQNDIWAAKLELRGPNGKRRPAAAKTGTTNDARDLGTYGYLAPTKKGVGLVVGVWMGNSDHSYPRSRRAALACVHARLHQGLGDHLVPAAVRARQGDDRRVVRWQARPLDPRDDDSLVHPRHAARRPQCDRP
jgi:membrane peptidoglycan carboxypeptidase